MLVRMCFLLQLAIVLLLNIVVFCFCGMVDRTAKRLHIQAGSVAAFCTLLLFLSAFTVSVGDKASVSPAGLMLLLVCAMLCQGGPDIVNAVLLAIPAGVSGWLLCRFYPNVYEPGAFIAIPAVLFSYFAFRRKRQALLCAVMAPVIFALCASIEDACLFGMVYISIGSKAVLDAQIAAMIGLSLLWYLPERWRVRTKNMRLAKN